MHDYIVVIFFIFPFPIPLSKKAADLYLEDLKNIGMSNQTNLWNGCEK